ncbi:MAG: 1-deoxy-D-xylulose-5-phosphate synthase, partial [Nitrospirae bacterium]|nr:1-deoxy-D-xylulose-5-phosphate synthase [Nitrospirota bacterium]
DVGHQVYVHKLLTGRREGFQSLRQFGGISGFARRCESPFDAFGAGHAATSISAALGMVEARDQQGSDYKVIAVIGDGAMTAGMAFEALNQAGALGKDFIVILNDNEMSISKNVGAISAYLSRIITGGFYTRVKKETEDLIRTIPRIGKPMLKVAKKAEESVKGLMGPGILFEELGFRYAGPIDGHRFDHLLPTLENVKKLQGPVLIHVVTRKGFGYEPAEKDPIAYHGVSAFDPETGKAKKKSGLPTYTQIFSQALIQLAQKDEKIVAITAAMPEGTGLNQFAKVFPNRFYDVGIAEQHAVTFSAGLAADGMRPVTAIYSTFLQRGYDQLVHDVCLQNLPVTFALDRAGLVGEDGPTHHGAFDMAYLRHIPNMIVMAPKDENELRHMLYTALLFPGPAAVRYPRGNGYGVPLDEAFRRLEIGQGEVLLEGRDIALLAIGRMVYPAMEAATILREEGLDVGVLNARYVKPLDQSLILETVERYKGLVTVEDGCLAGGFGSAVLEFLESQDLVGIPVRRLGLPDQYIEHGSQKELWRLCGLDAQGIADSVRTFVRKMVSPFPHHARP